MSWRASSTVVSGDACSGSLVIHADTGEFVRSLPDAAARSTSRSVRMPVRKRLCMMSADPTFCRTMAAAASATGSSGLVVTTRVVITSRTVSVRPGRLESSATLADLIEFRVRVRGGRAGQFLGQHAPQRPGPRGNLRPSHPEDLQGCLIELGVRLLGRDRVGEVLELMDEFEEAVCVSFHVITFGRRRTASWVVAEAAICAECGGLYPERARPKSRQPSDAARARAVPPPRMRAGRPA